MDKANLDALRAISTAVASVAQDPAVPGLSPSAAPSVANAVADQLAPVLVNATNNEEWFRSRVMLGSITAIVAGIAGLVNEVKAGSYDVTVISTSIFGIFGGAVSIYGRFIARKPIGA